MTCHTHKKYEKLYQKTRWSCFLCVTDWEQINYLADTHKYTTLDMESHFPCLFINKMQTHKITNGNFNFCLLKKYENNEVDFHEKAKKQFVRLFVVGEWTSAINSKY